jgi:outer membrane receptor protein involved in Fe transport
MRKSYRFLVAWIFAGLISIAASSQSVSISGNVRNITSLEPVPAVTVSVKETNLATFTDEKGNFKIAVPRLPVTLIFTSASYAEQEVTVNSASETLKVDFLPSTTLGEEVVVAATRTPTRILESPVTVERMSGASLRAIAAPNYYEAITNLKGVDMHTASLTFRTVTTRGFLSSGNTRMNQLIDGMDNQAPGLNFSVGNIVGLTELDVDNIELLSGASSALYGSGGMNGTLLLTSKNPFKFQGLSFNVKQGIMHVDGRQRNLSPYYDWAVRYAKAFNDKFAFKLSAQLVKANDWQADDYRNKQQIGVLSTVAPGNRLTDPNFNGINMYGDETSANMRSFALLVQEQTRLGIIAAGGPDVVVAANNYFSFIGDPLYPTNAQIAGFVGMFPASLQPTITNMIPFYVGARKNYFQNYSVSRTGYEEKFLVDYNTMNFKFTGGLHYKITPTVEASWNTYFGTGTTVYTGADRYSLRNLKIAQHKLEFKQKNWFLRGYTTQENAGESYNASALGGYLNESWKPSATWFAQYIGTFSENRRLGQAAITDYNAHIAARAAADVGRLLPGTTGFTSAVKTIRNTPIVKGGALFLDRSDLYAAEGQLNLSEVTHFTDKLGVLVGASWKQWVMNSKGTIFADTAGPIKINESGAYIQLKKSFIKNILSITAAGRYDKQTNFDGQFTPRVTAVVKVADNNFLRFSYQTAYRFPTNQDQYISLITGAGILIGCLPQFQTFYKLNSSPGYTPESILAYRNSGNPANTSILVKGTYKEVVPETVSSFEVGYKGVIAKRLLIDLYGYFSQYQNFLARLGFGQAKFGNTTDVFSPFTTVNISYIQNTDTKVKSIGWGFGLDYQFPRGYNFYGNIYSDELRDVPAGFVTYFNAPKYRWNLGLRNEDVYKHVGFNIIVKYQDNNFYEGTFVTGTLPYFTTVDAQITYHVPKTKSVFRIGGTNIGNNYYRTAFGNPSVGGLYYVSFGYNIF